jgi:hypothetical protein
MEKISIKADHGLVNGTSIITTYKQTSDKEWVEEALKNRKWGVHGKIIGESNGHGFCYIVKHSDGTEAAYEPQELVSMDQLTKIRADVQNTIRSIDLEVTFYNPFNKSNRRARIAPERFLVCFINGLEKRNTIFNELVMMGYTCERKGKVYEDKNNQQSMLPEKFWTFQIDLFK